MNKWLVASLALVTLLTSTSTSPALAQRGNGKPGGGGGGGGSAPDCPAETLLFFPQTSAELQRAFDCASPGATITLRAGAGAVYEGRFTLRHKAQAATPQPIVVKSEHADTLTENVRVDPGQEANMAWLRVPPGASEPVLTTELKTLADGTRRAASHYTFVGIKFATDHWVGHLVRLGTATEKLVDELPTGVTFDRSYFAGSPGQGTKQGLVANGRDIRVTSSWFKDFKDTDNDALAIAIWNGAGPYLVENNYLEASGENMMAGGGDPTIANLVPSDITVRWNHFFKPTAWTTELSTLNGKKWRVKNLFELKNAERVLVEGNVFENNWIQADQHGFAIQLTPRNQNGGCRWCRVWDVTFRYNVVRNSTAGINLLVTDNSRRSEQLRRIAIRHNLLLNINGGAIAGTPTLDRAGRLIQILNFSSTVDPIDLLVEHNTAFQGREFSFSGDRKTAGIHMRWNVGRHNPCIAGNDCGISGNNTAPGGTTIATWFGEPKEVSGNVLFDAGHDRAAEYPAGNTFPATVTFRSDAASPPAPIDKLDGEGSTDADYTLIDPVVADPRLNGKPVGVDWTVLKAYADFATGLTQP